MPCPTSRQVLSEPQVVNCHQSTPMLQPLTPPPPLLKGGLGSAMTSHPWDVRESGVPRQGGGIPVVGGLPGRGGGVGMPVCLPVRGLLSCRVKGWEFVGPLCLSHSV